jgi:F0F1-type ATP synthase assembly protein I
MSKPDDSDGLSKQALAYRAAAPWIDIVWRFIGTVLFCLALGYAVDRWRGWETPWGVLLGGTLGTVMGLFFFLSMSLKKLSSAQGKKS